MKTEVTHKPLRSSLFAVGIFVIKTYLKTRHLKNGAYVMKTYLKKRASRLLLLFIIAGVFVCQCNAKTTNTDTTGKLIARNDADIAKASTNTNTNPKKVSTDTNIGPEDIYAGLGYANDPVPFMQEARKGVLPNGLKYYILKNNEPKDKAYLALAVNAGSVLEKNDEQGFANFVTLVGLKGAKRLAQYYFRLTAAKVGTSASVTTGFDETIYRCEVPIKTGKDKVKRIPQEALNILDYLTHAVTFNQKDIDDGRRVILETFEKKRLEEAKRLEAKRLKEAKRLEEAKRLQDIATAKSNNQEAPASPLPAVYCPILCENVAWEKTDRAVWDILHKDSPYANRFQGTKIIMQDARLHFPASLEEIIKTASPSSSKLKDFYNRWYRTDNMALVFVGDFDDSVLEKSLLARFCASAPKTPLQRPAYDLPLPLKGRLDVETLIDATQSCIKTYIYYKRKPKPIACDIASHRQYFMDKLIDNMFHRRLHLNKKIPYSLSLDQVRFASKSQFYAFIAQTKPKTDKAEETIKHILQEKERVLRYGWTDSEIELAKLSLMPSFESAADSESRNRTYYSSEYYASCFLDHFLGKACMIADYEWNLLAAKKMFPLITAKDLADASKDYFIEDDLSIFVLASSKDKLPSKAKICKIVEDVKKSKISPPTPEVIDYKLLHKDPTPGSILKETIDPTTKAIILDLSNGSKVILKQTTDNKSNEIDLYALAKGGTMAATGEDIVSARFASDILYRSGGIGPYSRKELENKLMGKQVLINSIIIDPSDRSLRGYSSVKDIKTLFELIYLDFNFTCQKIKIDSSQIKDLVKCKRELSDQDADTNFSFGKEIKKTIYGDSPHFNPIKMSDFSKISKERALKFLKKCFNPSDFTFVFVGDIDIETFKPYIKTYIASIPIPPLKLVDNQKNDSFACPKPIKKEVYMGKGAKSDVRMFWVANEKYSQNMDAISKVLLRYVHIILKKHIHMGDKLEDTYLVGVPPLDDCHCCRHDGYDGDAGLDPFLNKLFMNVYLLSCDTKRVEELISAVFKDIENIAQGNIDTDILIKAKKAEQKEWYAYHSFIPESYARSAVLYNTPLNRIDKLPLLIEAVSKQDLKDIAARLLKSKYYQIVLHPKK
jgi:zinc protease